MGEITTHRDSNYYVFADDTTYDQWIEIGKNLIQATQNIMWWIGDWWNFGERKYGELAAQALDMDIPYSTFATASYVANKIPSERRVKELTFSHHQEVASLQEQDQDKYLKTAYDKKMSVKALRTLVKKQKIVEKLESTNTNVDLDTLNINFKPTNNWSFGINNELFGYDSTKKTPPQMIANLLYFFGDDPDNTKIIDISDKYQVTYDIGLAMGYKVASYDLNPNLLTKKVSKFDFVNEMWPDEITQADVVILNMLDVVDDSSLEVDPENYLKANILNFNQYMKTGAKLIVISPEFETMKLENTFSLVYDSTDFGVNEFIATHTKKKYTREDQIEAIANKKLLDDFAYILVLIK